MAKRSGCKKDEMFYAGKCVPGMDKEYGDSKDKGCPFTFSKNTMIYFLEDAHKKESYTVRRLRPLIKKLTHKQMQYIDKNLNYGRETAPIDVIFPPALDVMRRDGLLGKDSFIDGV